MSLFAKIFIVINLVLTLVLTFLMATLLGQKSDYRAQHQEVHRKERETTEDLKQSEKDWRANIESLQRHTDRKERTGQEAARDLASKKELLKKYDDELFKLDAEVSKEEGSKRSMEDKFKGRNQRKTDLNTEIGNAQTSREQRIKETKELQGQLSDLETKHLDLLGKQSAKNKVVIKQVTELTQLEMLKRAIQQRHLELRIPEPWKDLSGTVVRVTASDKLVTLDMGRDHGVDLHQLFRVSRGNQFICLVKVQDVRKEQSSARIEGSGSPQAGDKVKTATSEQ